MSQNLTGRFSGTFYGTVTDHRIVIPKTFVNELKFYGDIKRIVITRGDKECLLLFPESVYNKYCDILEVGNSKDQQKLAAWEHFSSGIKILEANGRVRLSQKILESTSIHKDIKFVGQKDHITIWSKEVSDKLEQELLDFLSNSNMESSIRI